MTVSIGLAGALGPELIGALAPQIEAAGFDALWVNDTPDGDALAALAAAGRVTERLRLATGVIPVDRRPAAAIVDDVRALALPTDRLVVGIGSGGAREGALRRVAEAIETLRALAPTRLAIGALGPRMRRLGVERADGIVLNWLTPTVAGEQSAEAHADDPQTRVVLYVRTALEPSASARLADEAHRYASYPNYAANFARTRTAVTDTVIDGADALEPRLRAYSAAVDEVVLRAITPEDTLDAYRGFLRRAAPSL
jgi:alkanesulfonate monooxygenase SsuD/methylene tetrahydromethanopterin reductase-like flavin-dependent oxidoreductase (luciferase family)